MTNIKSLDDFLDNNDQMPFSYAGGHNSAIGINGAGHEVRLYADGFIVDNGPFRPLSDPTNAKFLSDIKSGIAPPEFQDGNREVNVHVIDNSSKYFLDQNSNPNGSSRHKVEKIDTEWCLGENNTVLRIKLFTGDLVNLTISQEATIADLKRFISEHSKKDIVSLLFGFPPKKINFEDSTTLREADILNCNVIQK